MLPAPEPSAHLAMAAAAMTLLGLRRRRR